MFRSTFISLIKSSVRNDFSVAFEHMEQVKPLTCSSALVICALAAPIDSASMAINNFRVFIFDQKLIVKNKE